MNSFDMGRFYALLKRELWEHKGQLVYTPIVVALLVLLSLVWAVAALGIESLSATREFVASTGEGVQLTAFMLGALPFAFVIPVYSAFYLLSSLYQERKDLSIYFWQSMPVSNSQTVISKIVIVSLVAPLIATAVIFLLFLIATLLFAAQGLFSDGLLNGVFQSLTAATSASILIFLTILKTALWFFPTIGWILLFSAFARSVPLLWAIGVYILVLFLEDFIFSTQFLANWTNSRTNVSQYLVWSVPDFFTGLIDYDLLIGVAFGTILVAGSIYMRRFAD